MVLFDQTQRLDHFDPEHPGELFERLARIPDGGNTALRDAVTFTLKNLGASGGRSAIVLLTDGVDTVSQEPAGAGEGGPVEGGDDLPDGLPGVARGGRARSPGGVKELDRLAQLTGGRLFRLPSEQALPGVLDEILADLKAQYVLGFSPSEGGAPAGCARSSEGGGPREGRVRHRVGYRLEP